MRELIVYSLLALGSALFVACAAMPTGQSLSDTRGTCYTYMNHGERSCPNQVDICDQALRGLENYESEEGCKAYCDQRHRELVQKYPLSCNYVVRAAYGECRNYCRGLENSVMVQ